MPALMGELLRLMFVMRPGEVPGAEELVKSWRAAFDLWEGPGKPGICIWVTGDSLLEPKIPNVCFHRLFLPASIDFYGRSPLERKPWSPWGLKSGPNFQFFRILQDMCAAHRSQWVLQLEADTVPLRPVKEADIGWFLHDPNAWIAGAAADFAKKGSLSSSTANHLNGAAFYRIGDPMFIRFLQLTWTRSLLYLVNYRPAIAYDSLTSPGVWEELPWELRESWRENSYRFFQVEGMVNLSNRLLASSNHLKQLDEVGIRNDLENSPWFLHLAKTRAKRQRFLRKISRPRPRRL